MPCRSGSPQVVFSVGACAAVLVAETDMTPPTAAAAMATVITEPENRSSMMISFCHLPCCELLKWILLNPRKFRDIIFRRQVSSSAPENDDRHERRGCSARL